MSIEHTLHHQIEEAFQYRGHVTLVLSSGRKVEGFLYNREFRNPRLVQDHFVEVMLAGSGESRRFAIAELEAVHLSGEDCAAGKSYAEWLEKKKNEIQKA